MPFIVGFQKGRSGPGPGTRILDSVRPLGPWCFPVRQGRVFVDTAAAAANFLIYLFIVGFQKGRSGPGTRILGPVRPLGPWCFPVRQGHVFVVTAAAEAAAANFLIYLLL